MRLAKKLPSIFAVRKPEVELPCGPRSLRAAAGPPLHYHENEDELFLVQEGRAGFFYDDQWHEVGRGGVVFMPRKVIHTIKNIGDTPSRMLIQTHPAGFETFFARRAQEFAKPGGPDMQRIVAISAEQGIHH